MPGMASDVHEFSQSPLMRVGSRVGEAPTAVSFENI